MKTVLKIDCAWCGESLGEKDGEGVEGETSGICSCCMKKMLAGVPYDPMTRKFIEAA